MKQVAAATILGYLPKGEEESLCEACIEALKSFIDDCEEAITRAVVFVLAAEYQKLAEDIVNGARLNCWVDVCPVQVATTDINYLAREYGRAHRLEVMCVH